MPQYFKSSIIEGFVDLAKEKNLLPELVEKQTLKTASTNSQDDLSSDNQILSLIESMHDRGMFVQAENLSQSFMSYKQAQSAYKSDYSVLLTAAHPDGDARVSESGVFHTLESTQEAMLAALQKKASATKLVDMVKTALDTKMGQVFLPEVEIIGKPGGSDDESSPIGNDPNSDGLKKILSPEQEKITKETQEKIEQFDKSVSTTLGKLATFKDKIKQIYTDVSVFEDAIISNSPLGIAYCQINKIDISAASNDLKEKQYYIGSGQVDAAEAITILANKIATDTKAGYTDSAIPHQCRVLPNTSKWQSRFQTASVESGDIENYRTNNGGWGTIPISGNSVYKYFVPTIGKAHFKVSLGEVTTIATEFVNEKIANYTKYINQSYLNNFNNYLGAVMENLSSEISSINFKINASPLLTKANCLKLHEIIQEKEKTVVNILEEDPYFSTVFPDYTSIGSAYLQAIDGSLSALTEFITANPMFPDLEIELPLDAAPAIEMVTIAADNWRNYFKSLPNNSEGKETEEHVKTREIYNNLSNLISVLKSSKTLGEFNIKWKSPFKMMNEFYSYINSIKEGAPQEKRNLTVSDLPQDDALELDKKTSSQKNSLIKKSDYSGNTGANGGKTPPKPTGGVKTTPPATNLGKSVGFNVNVQTMQFAIQQYAATLLKNKKASDLAVSKMLSVGPKNSNSPANMDGVWGSQTASALETSNEHIQGKPLIVRPTSLDADAKKNTEILVAAKNYVDGYSGGSNSPGGANNPELDRIEFGMTSDFGYTVVDGEKSLHSSDLNSLKSLYSFLYNNDLVSAIGEENERGYTIKMWGQILNGLSKRAEDQEAKANSSVKANAATIFKKKIGNLVLTWRRYLSSNFKKGLEGKENFIISEQFLSSPGLRGNSPGSTSVGDGFSGSGGKNSAGKGGGKGSGKSSLDGETYEVGGGTAGSSSFDDGDADPTVLPFTRTINFSNPWWGNTAIAQESPGQYLSIKGFAGSNATTRAQMMFSNDENMQSDQDLQEQYIVKNRGLRLDQERGWDGETYWVFVAGQRNSIPLNTYPNFQKNFGLIQNQTILDKYRNYLQSLKQGLTSSYQNWIESGPAETAIEQVQHYHQRWVEAINNQINQVNRTFQKYR